MDEERDIVIAGAGMVGMSLALLLRAQLPETIGVTLLEGNQLSIPGDFQDNYPAFDSRTTALSYSSRRIFENIGIWKLFENNASLINSIHVSSKGRFGSALLTSTDYGWPALGYVAENLAFPSSFKPTGLEKIPKVNELMGVKFCSPYLAEIFPSSDILSSDITTSSREAGI